MHTRVHGPPHTHPQWQAGSGRDDDKAGVCVSLLHPASQGPPRPGHTRPHTGAGEPAQAPAPANVSPSSEAPPQTRAEGTVGLRPLPLGPAAGGRGVGLSRRGWSISYTRVQGRQREGGEPTASLPGRPVSTPSDATPPPRLRWPGQASCRSPHLSSLPGLVLSILTFLPKLCATSLQRGTKSHARTGPCAHIPCSRSGPGLSLEGHMWARKRQGQWRRGTAGRRHALRGTLPECTAVSAWHPGIDGRPGPAGAGS